MKHRKVKMKQRKKLKQKYRNTNDVSLTFYFNSDLHINKFTETSIINKCKQ